MLDIEEKWFSLPHKDKEYRNKIIELNKKSWYLNRDIKKNERIIIRKTGEEKYIKFLMFNIMCGEKPMGLQAIQAIDITKQKKIEEELKESKEYYSAIINNVNQSIFKINKEGELLLINNNAARQFSGQPRDFIGKNIKDLFPKKEAEERIAAINLVLKTGKPHKSKRKVLIQGKKLWYETNLQPIKNKSGKIDSVLGFATDITERKKAEDELKKRAEELENFSEFAVGRELKMTELKKEINKLCKKLGEKPRYSIK